MTKEDDVRNKLRAVFSGIKEMSVEHSKPCKFCPWVNTICHGFINRPPCLWSDVEVEELVNNVAERVQIEWD